MIYDMFPRCISPTMNNSALDYVHPPYPSDSLSYIESSIEENSFFQLRA